MWPENRHFPAHVRGFFRVSRNYDRNNQRIAMPPPEKQTSRTNDLPSGAGVMIGAGLGALMWLGAFALLW